MLPIVAEAGDILRNTKNKKILGKEGIRQRGECAKTPVPGLEKKAVALNIEC